MPDGENTGLVSASSSRSVTVACRVVPTTTPGGSVPNDSDTVSSSLSASSLAVIRNDCDVSFAANTTAPALRPATV